MEYDITDRDGEGPLTQESERWVRDIVMKVEDETDGASVMRNVAAWQRRQNWEAPASEEGAAVNQDLSK